MNTFRSTLLLAPYKETRLIVAMFVCRHVYTCCRFQLEVFRLLDG